MGNKKGTEEARQRAREVKRRSERRRGILLSVLVLLSAVLVSLLGCVGGTGTRTSVQEEVKGKLLVEESRQPLAGATIVLAQYYSENEWLLRADLATKTDNEGIFVLAGVAPGSYLVLYDRTGEALAAKESWNGKELSFLDNMILVCQDSETRAEFAYAPIRSGITYPGHGHVVILEWGLILEYKVKESAAFGEGTPVQIRVEPNQITEIEILASCTPAAVEEREAPTAPVEEKVAPAQEEEEEVAPAKSGEWIASIEIGEIRFTVNPDGTGIAKIFLHIPGEFKCGVATATNSRLTFENPSLWPITEGGFTVETSTRHWDIVIQGKVDETGKHASGTWQISSAGTICASGTWESSQAP